MRTEETSNVQQMDRRTSAAVRRGVAEVLRQARLDMQQESDTNLPPNLQRLLAELTKYD